MILAICIPEKNVGGEEISTVDQSQDQRAIDYLCPCARQRGQMAVALEITGALVKKELRAVPLPSCLLVMIDAF